LKYLARYTHRVAISSSRLLSLEDGRVTFRWRDSKHGNQVKPMTLDAAEFIRRFLLHVLPSGFVKIRHFGFLSNRNRRSALALCRTLLKAAPGAQANAWILSHEQRSALERRCPFCHAGALHLVEWLSADQMLTSLQNESSAHPIDSS
jgi:Putative transposase